MAAAFCTHVNSDGIDDASSGSSLSTTAGFSATAGNFIVVGVYAPTTTGTVTSVTDTAGNTYVHAVSKVGPASTIEMWYAENITGNASNKITANWSAAFTFRTVVVMEFVGVKTSGSLDTTASGTGTGSSTSGSFTTANANEVVIAIGALDNNSNIWAGGIAAGLTPIGVFYTETNTSVCIAYVVTNSILTATTVRLYATSRPSSATEMGVGTFLLATAAGGGGGGSYGFA